MGVGGFVHVVLGPLVQTTGLNRFHSVAIIPLAIEVVAGIHGEESIRLFTHSVT